MMFMIQIGVRCKSEQKKWSIAQRKEQMARQAAQLKAQRAAEAEARRKASLEAKLKAEREARLKAEQERQRKAAEETRRQAEEAQRKEQMARQAALWRAKLKNDNVCNQKKLIAGTSLVLIIDVFVAVPMHVAVALPLIIPGAQPLTPAALKAIEIFDIGVLLPLNVLAFKLMMDSGCITTGN